MWVICWGRLIIGSFNTEGEAQSYAEQIIGVNYEVKILTSPLSI